MFATCLALVVFADGIAIDSMRDILRTRQARLDRVTIRMETQSHRVAANFGPLDRAHWSAGFSTPVFPYEISIARPHLLLHSLADDPVGGFEPVRIALADGTYTLAYDRPTPAGDDVFITMPMSKLGLPFSCTPILAFLDYQYFDSAVPFLDTLKLFEEYTPELVSATGDVSTYVATVPMPERGTTQAIELDLDADGVTRRFRATCSFDSPHLQPYTLEMYTLEVNALDGVRYASECAYVVRNPNVATEHYTVHHFRITCVDRDESLTPQQCMLPISRCSSYVSVVDDHGVCLRSHYDAAGNVLGQEQLLGSAPSDGVAAVVPRDSIRSRWIVAATSVAVAAVASAALIRRSRRRPGSDERRDRAGSCQRGARPLPSAT